MNNGRFLEQLSDREKASLSDLINELSSSAAMGNSESYELVSRQKAVQSRMVLINLSEVEKFDLRVYGRYGLIINQSLRALPPITTLANDNTDLPVARRNISLFRQTLGNPSMDNLAQLNGSMVRTELFKQRLVSSYRFVINDLIDRYASSYSRSGNYLYRISRAKKNTFASKEEAEYQNLAIQLGDIISDNAFWSTASDAGVDLFRYSIHGRHASNSKPLDPSEEEVLFAIENNAHLKSIDISGFKFKKDQLSSGEQLIKTNTTFRVLGIEHSSPNMQRRVVIVRPEPNIAPQDIVRNPFSGEFIIP